jgi:hypothetical protein
MMFVVLDVELDSMPGMAIGYVRLLSSSGTKYIPARLYIG